MSEEKPRRPSEFTSDCTISIEGKETVYPAARRRGPATTLPSEGPTEQVYIEICGPEIVYNPPRPPAPPKPPEAK